MNALPAISSPELISPLASKLVQFLSQKHAMGYRYREEGRALRELDRFLNTRLSPEDPVITLTIVHDYVARRGTESETTRAHRLTLIREVCRFLRLEDARTVVPDRRSLRIVRQKFVPRVLSRDEGKRFLQASAELPKGRTSPVRDAVLGTALRLLYLAACAPENFYGSHRPMSTSTQACCISGIPSSTSQEWFRLRRTWLSNWRAAGRWQPSTSPAALPRSRSFPAHAGDGIRLPPCAMRSTKH